MTIPTRVEQVKSGVWCVHDLLDESECQEVMDRGMAGGIEESPAAGDRRHRNHNVHRFESRELASKLWERIRDLVPQEYHFQDADTPVDGFQQESIRDMIGRWRSGGVKSTFTLLYYPSGGHFGPHRDNYKIISDHERSLLTLSVYLNDRPAGHGGATQFVQEETMTQLPMPDEDQRIQASEETIEVQVEADRAGKAIFFHHDLMHQGQPVDVEGAPSAQAAPKWLLLTQVLYLRDPATAPAWTESQFEARRILALAEKAEVEGDIQVAIRLYNCAYRLDPALELP
mmetsp:Transcript_22493/g.53018  ORF Transcript_22493/g.53018 Transcript_22493/m.53018 type:complete len:286 (-) Transcript_22493:172-1029(-)